MKPVATLSKNGPGLKNISAGLLRLTGDQVLVGIPESANPRQGEDLKREPIGNAALLYILTHGSPVRGIPATPIIEPALKAADNRKRIVGILRQAAEAELAGDHNGALVLLAKAGTAGANAAKRWFTDPRNGWPPNALSTINRKLDKLKPKAREAAIDAIVAAKGDPTGIVTRNIDKGELRRALTYVVVDAGEQAQQPSANQLDDFGLDAGEEAEASEFLDAAVLL